MATPKRNAPSVSIILPTYNRRRFLDEAIEAIRSQTFPDWELIIVDDGSTDGTKEFLEQRLEEIHQPWEYIYQENQGPSAARNRGLEVANGEFVAFYDSDDVWLPHHLSECVEILHSYPEVDWVYAATRIVDLETNEVLSPTCFYSNKTPRPFLNNVFQRSDHLFVIPPKQALRISLTNGLHCGLQTSVIRSALTSRLRIPPFSVGEDQAWIILAASSGVSFGCINNVNVEYRQHSNGLSARPTKSSLKNIETRMELTRAYEYALRNAQLDNDEDSILRKRIRDELFWGVGYEYQKLGRFQDAMRIYQKAFRIWPWTLVQSKTVVVSFIRSLLRNSSTEKQ